MKTPSIHMINAETQEETIREMNAEELAQWKVNLENTKIEEDDAKTKAAAKAALFARLGLTADEAKLLLS